MVSSTNVAPSSKNTAALLRAFRSHSGVVSASESGSGANVPSSFFIKLSTIPLSFTKEVKLSGLCAWCSGVATSRTVGAESGIVGLPEVEGSFSKKE